MRFTLFISMAAGLCLCFNIPLLAQAAKGKEESPLKPDLDRLDQAGLTPAGKESARQLLLGRAKSFPDSAEINGHVEKMATGKKEEWGSAQQNLIFWGEHAVGPLKSAILKSTDKGLIERANKCLLVLQGPESEKLIESAMRILAANPSGDSANALIEYLPFAGEGALREGCIGALFDVSEKGSESLKAVLNRLTDSHPARRAVAAEMGVRFGGAQSRERLKPLYSDPSMMVRKTLVSTLLELLDPEAIPLAIDLMNSVSSEEFHGVENQLIEIAGEWGVQGPRLEDSLSNAIRKGIWSAWWEKINSKELLGPLQKLTPNEKVLMEANRLLANSDLPALKKFLDENLNETNSWLAGLLIVRSRDNPEVGKNLSGYSSLIANLSKSIFVQPSYLKLVQMRDPPGGLEALAAVFPVCVEEEEQENLAQALVALSKRRNDLPPLWKNLVNSPLPEYRVLASRVLPLLNFLAAKELVAALLNDPNPVVRAEAAMGQIRVGVKSPVGNLVALMPQLTKDKLEHVEQYLALLAGENAPSGTWDTEEARKKTAGLWKAWWEKSGSTLEINPEIFEKKNPKNFLVTEAYDPQRRFGRVFLLNPKGKMLWEVGNLSTPTDARLLGNSKLLVCEGGLNRVTERDLKGKILWEKQAVAPFAVQRLPNGNIFIACRNSLLEVDRQGKEVFKYTLNNDTILAAGRFSSNHISFVTYGGNYVRLDNAGKEIQKGRIPFPTNYGVSGGGFASAERFLVSIPQLNKVMEYDLQGKQTWEGDVVAPGNPVKLANGNVLVPAMNSTKLLEVRRDGRVAWESAPGQFKAIKAWKYP